MQLNKQDLARAINAFLTDKGNSPLRSMSHNQLVRLERLLSVELQRRGGERPSGDEAKPDTGRSRYRAYLKSPEWLTLRNQTFERDNHLCVACGHIAACVHHRNYSVDTMAGRKPAKLVSLCETCHDKIHPKGEKFREQPCDARLAQLISENGRSQFLHEQVLKDMKKLLVGV